MYWTRAWGWWEVSDLGPQNRISFSSKNWRISFEMFMRYRVQKNGTNSRPAGQPRNIMPWPQQSLAHRHKNTVKVDIYKITVKGNKKCFFCSLWKQKEQGWRKEKMQKEQDEMVQGWKERKEGKNRGRTQKGKKMENITLKVMERGRERWREEKQRTGKDTAFNM